MPKEPKSSELPFDFQGFPYSNTTPVPDVLFDALLVYLSGAELKVLLYIIRRTFGFKKNSDNISLNQMLSGITTRDGRVLDLGAGLSKPTLLQALRSLQEKNIIETERQSSKERGNEPTLYRLKFSDITSGQSFIPPLDKKLYQGVGKETSPSPRTNNLSIQETVLQETDIHSNSKANREKRVSEENHNPVPDSNNHRKHSQANGYEQRESRGGYNASGTEETDTQSQNVQSRKRKPRRNSEEEGVVNNFSNPTTKRGFQSLAASLPRQEHQEPEIDFTEARQVIQLYITDFAREFNDQAPLRSSSTRALNLMKRAGVPLDVFVSRMHEARSITKESTGSIRTKSGADQHQIKAKMAYWFSVLEEGLGLADEKD